MERQSLRGSFSAAVLTGALLVGGGALGSTVYLVAQTFSLHGQFEEAKARLAETDRKLEALEKLISPEKASKTAAFSPTP